MDHGSHSTKQRGFFASRAGIVFIIFAVIASYFLWTEHRAHIALAIPYLPFLLLLACPLMHLFMHGGHGSHDGNSDNASDERKSSPHQH